MNLPPPIEDVGKSQRSGFKTFLYVLIGGGALACLTCGVGAFVFLRSEQGQRVVEGMRSATQLYSDAASAPGASELREAGCEIALVSTIGRLQAVGNAFAPEAIEEGSGSDDETIFVLCQVSSRRGPSCEEVARTYGEATSGSEHFAVAVAGGRDEESECSGLYQPDGTFLAELD